MKNMKPEKVVQSRVLWWSIRAGFWLHVIESKAVYSVAKKCYARSKAAPMGFPDLVGVGPRGESVFVELKAPGKISNTSYAQQRFLFDAIKRGAFALVTDSENHLEDVYRKWVLLKSQNLQEEAKLLLLGACSIPAEGPVLKRPRSSK